MKMAFARIQPIEAIGRKYYTIYDAKKWWVGIGQNVPSNSGMGVVSMHKTTKAWQSIR